MGETRHSEPREALGVKQEAEQQDVYLAQQFKDVYGGLTSATDLDGPQDGNRDDGVWCPIWRTKEDLPGDARIVYEEASRLSAVPLATLIRACGQIERRLQVWYTARWRERKGKRRGGASLPDVDAHS